MGRYIHAYTYNEIIYKYWFGKQDSELGSIIQPYGAEHIQIASPKDVFDVFQVENNVYEKMKSDLSHLLQLLEPHIREKKRLEIIFRRILQEIPDPIRFGHTMENTTEYKEAIQCLHQPTPVKILARLDLILTIIKLRPLGKLGSETLF